MTKVNIALMICCCFVFGQVSAGGGENIFADTINGNITGNVYGPTSSGDMTVKGLVKGNYFNDTSPLLTNLNVGAGNFIVPRRSDANVVTVGNAYDLWVTGSVQVFGQVKNDLVVTGSVLPYGGMSTPTMAYYVDGDCGVARLGNSMTTKVNLEGEDPCSFEGSVAVGAAPTMVTWSPDGDYLAVVSSLDDTLRIYTFTSTNPVLVGSIGTGEDSNPLAVAWAPDGRSLAVACAGDQTLHVYAFNGGNPQELGSVDVGDGARPHAVAWSPNGAYVALVNAYSNTLQIYVCAGGDPVKIGSVGTGDGSHPFSVSWSAQGDALAVVNAGNNTLLIYSFFGGDPILEGNTFTGTFTRPIGVSWAPDGKTLALVNVESNTLQIYTWTNGEVNLIGNISTGYGARPVSLAWSPRGKDIAVVNAVDSTLQIYSFFEGTLVLLGSVSTGEAFVPRSVSWRADGLRIAVVNVEGGDLRIYAVSPSLNRPVLQVTGNVDVQGDLSVGGPVQLDATKVLGALTVNACNVSIGQQAELGGLGVLMIGANGGKGGDSISNAGGNGGSGGAGEIVLGGFGGYASERDPQGPSGVYGDGVMSIGAHYGVATKHSQSPSDSAPLTYRFDLAQTWTVEPLIVFDAYVTSGASSDGKTHGYHETFAVTLNEVEEDRILANESVSYAYSNEAGTISSDTLPVFLPTPVRDGNCLTITLQPPTNGQVPYVTSVQAAGPVVRIL